MIIAMKLSNQFFKEKSPDDELKLKVTQKDLEPESPDDHHLNPWDTKAETPESSITSITDEGLLTPQVITSGKKQKAIIKGNHLHEQSCSVDV